MSFRRCEVDEGSMRGRRSGDVQGDEADGHKNRLAHEEPLDARWMDEQEGELDNPEDQERDHAAGAVRAVSIRFGHSGQSGEKDKVLRDVCRVWKMIGNVPEAWRQGDEDLTSAFTPCTPSRSAGEGGQGEREDTAPV